jgi:hypothetical protein
MSVEIFKLRKRREFASDLKAVFNTPEGKRFFKVFLSHCGVTQPQFHKDPMEINWWESRRHLAMSYLRILAQDDLEALLNQFEQQIQDDKERQEHE